MTVINTNVGALQARTYAVRADGNVTKAMERLSSGLRINSAADDAAGLAVANKMESQIRGMNMAIRNSQDGISLVQTAESAMGEINNMVIRMRELAVQMNNGVYTDTDRANAQLEVTALLAEIDKVATNSAFNQVKILDGTYSQDIRAGNTNPEIINVTIDRMNTDSLGGGRVTTGVAAATKDAAGNVLGNMLTAGSSLPGKFETAITVQEGRPVIDMTTLGGKDLLSAGYTASLSVNTGSKFMIDGSNQITLNNNTSAAGFAPELNFDGTTASNNVHTFTISYTDGTNTTTEEVTLTVADRPVEAGTNATSSSLSVEESACVKIQAGVNSSGDLVSVLSDSTKEFIEEAALNGDTITYALADTSTINDATDGDFTINTSTGEIIASLDYERPTGGASDDSNTYTFNVTVTNGTTNATHTETVTLEVTDHDGRLTAAVDTDEAVWAATSVEAGSVNVAYTNGARDGYSAGTESVVAEANAISVASGTNAANVVDLMASIAGIAAFVGVHTDAGADGFEIVSIGDTAGTTGANNLATGVTLGADGTMTVGTSATAQTIEDVHIRLTADNGRTFDVFTDITIGAATGAAGSFALTEAVKAGDYSSITVAAGGEAAVIDLKAGSTTGDGTFDEMSNFYANNPCGVFTIETGTAQFNGSTSATEVSNLTVDNSGNINLAEGAAAGTYTATVYYEDNEGDTFAQRVDIIVSEVGIRGENGNGTAADMSAIAVANGPSPSSANSIDKAEQVEGVSVINITEARQGTIKSVGTDAVLSTALTTFANTDHPGGSFSISGTDAELFSIDSATGDITTKGLVDYESKTSYDFSVTYTNGNDDYTEAVTLRVADDKVDNTTHISNVDLGTQDGAASAVTILDTAINQISSSQAKLGAIQNRLQYNIDNLSKASMLTQTAKGRIMDADFASETSELSKQQILSQAATSMLAQANQSKQSVLALLQ